MIDLKNNLRSSRMELDFRKDPGILSTAVDAMAVGVFAVEHGQSSLSEA